MDMEVSAHKAPSLTSNTAWMLIGRLARILVQAGYFVLLARSLGVMQYGAFIAAAGLAGVLSPFASIGTGSLLIKHVARDPSTFRNSWADALITTVVSGLMLSGVGFFAARFVLPHSIPAGVVLPLIFAELIFARLLEVAGQAFMAFERMRRTAILLLGLSVARMVAAGFLMLIFRRPSASIWAELYLLSTVVPAILAVLSVNRQLGNPVPRYSLRGAELVQGLYFSISLSAQTIYNDIDKTMLARLSGLSSAGLYGAAYRLIDVAASPLGALTASTYSRFFKHGDKGLAAATRFARKLLPTTMLYGAACSCALVLLAPLLRPVLGQQYADSISAVRWLAPIVLLRCIHYIGADTLSGSDYQGVRSSIQGAVAAANILMNLYLLPRYSWRGAVASSLACDGLLALLIWGSIIILQNYDHDSARAVKRLRWQHNAPPLSSVATPFQGSSHEG
jgi:O-antigen/teichoic acid export membrane protein